MGRHALRRTCGVALLAFAIIGSLSITPATALPPIGTFDGFECVTLSEGGGAGVPIHVEFTGTFTGVPFLGAGTYHSDVNGSLTGKTFPGTWSMVHGGGSIFGSHTQTSTLQKPPPDFEARFVDWLTVAGGTGAYASVRGVIVAFGTRTLAEVQQEGCFETFHVSGLLISGLHMRYFAPIGGLVEGP